MSQLTYVAFGSAERQASGSGSKFSSALLLPDIIPLDGTPAAPSPDTTGPPRSPPTAVHRLGEGGRRVPAYVANLQNVIAMFRLYILF